MATPLYLSFSFLMQDWAKGADGLLWAIVQPHVFEAGGEEFTTLREWIKTTASPTGSTFQACPYNSCNTKLVIPVPFPDGCEVSVALHPPAAELAQPLPVKMSSHLRITDWKKFELANREPEKDVPAPDEEPQCPPPVPAAGTAYPSYYTAQLRHAEAARERANAETRCVQPAELAAMLQLAFWGGTRRSLPLDALVTGAELTNALQLQGSGPALRVTSMHSLAGLTFPLGTRAQVEALCKVTRLTIAVNGADVVDADVSTFFSSLEAVAADAGRDITVCWRDLRTRVYVRQGFGTFRPVRGTRFHRLARPTALRGGDCVPLAAPPGPAERLVLRTPSSVGPQITFQPYRSFGGKLTPYRKTREESGKRLLQFVPAAEHADAFYGVVATDAAAQSNLANARLIVETENGATVAPVLVGTGTAPEGSLQLVGSYALPWDGYRPADPAMSPQPPVSRLRTVLFVGALAPAERVTLSVPSATGPVTAAWIEVKDEKTTYVGAGDPPPRDPLGSRYEATTGLPPDVFDMLEASVAIDADSPLAVTFRGDFDFTLAHSVASVEGEIAVAYPPAVAEPMEAPDVARADLQNFKSLVPLAGNRRLFPWGNILPHRKDAQPTGLVQDFQFRSEEDRSPVGLKAPPAVAYARPSGKSARTKVAPAAREFYRDLYERMGKAAAVDFALDHAFGPTVEPAGDPMPRATWADFPVALPTDVVRAAGEGDAFFTIVSTKTATTAKEGFILRFRSEWLAPPAQGLDDPLWPTHVAAWRAVAELAHAGSILVRRHVLLFDYRAAAAAVQAGTADGGVAAGISVNDLPPWDVTQAVSERCSGWLKNASLPETDVELPPWTGSQLSDALLVAFDLEVVRREGAHPGREQVTQIVWRPEPPSPQQSATVKAALEHHLELLRVRCATIRTRANATDAPRIKRAAALLASRADDAAGWIIPAEHPDEKGTTHVDLSTWSFLPLGRHAQLGDRTFEAVKAHLAFVEEWLDEQPGWGAGLAALGKRMKALETLARPDNGGLLHAVVNAAAARVALATNDGPSSSARVQEAARQLLWTSLGSFGATKGFLYGRLSGGSGAALPDGFFKLTLTKIPDVVPAGTVNRRRGSPTEPKGVDRDVFSWRELLPGSHLPPSDAAGPAFLDALDDKRYGSTFKVERATWATVEDLIDPDGALERDAIATRTGDCTPKDPYLRLPSREPLKPPGAVYSGYIAALQRQTPPAELNSERLQQGEVTSQVNGAKAVRIASAGRRDRGVHESLFTMLFWISGDEEAATGIEGAFDNDDFYLVEVPKPLSQAPPGTTKNDDASNKKKAPLVGFYGKLLSEESGLGAAQAGELPEALSPAQLGVLREALEPNATNCKPPVGERIRLRRDSRNNLTIKLNDGFRGEVYAYRLAADAQPARGEEERRRRLLLMVNVPVSVWNPRSFQLHQMRNADCFADRFSQSAVAGGALHAYAYPIVKSGLDNCDLLVPRKTRTLRELLEKTVFSKEWFPNKPPEDWRGFHLSVTLEHRQRTSFLLEDGPSAFEEGDGTLPADTLALHPLDNFRFERVTGKEQMPWFRDEVEEFGLHVAWSSRTNDEILRFHDVKVRVTG